MADNEPQIELKKRARRRLVGASALALLAAIVLPMVMEHEPRQVGQDIQVRIPSQEGANYAARVIRGQDPAPSRPTLPPPVLASAPLAATPAAQVSSPVVPPPPPKGAKSEHDERGEREAAKAQEHKLTAARDAQAAVKELARREQVEARKEQEARKEAAQAEAAKTKRDTESSGKTKGRDSESSRAAAILNDEGASAKSSRFVIQLGSFKDPANAASLRGKASAEGVGAYVESAGDKTRVRAGPYSSREAAEAAAARLRKAGLAAAVTPAS